LIEKAYLLAHPGKILAEEFLRPLGISQARLAKDIGVSAKRINAIVAGQRRIDADMALRLGRYFHISPHFWMNLQARYEVEVAKTRLGDKIEREVKTLEE